MSFSIFRGLFMKKCDYVHCLIGFCYVGFRKWGKTKILQIRKVLEINTAGTFLVQGQITVENRPESSGWNRNDRSNRICFAGNHVWTNVSIFCVFKKELLLMNALLYIFILQKIKICSVFARKRRICLKDGNRGNRQSVFTGRRQENCPAASRLNLITASVIAIIIQ